MDCAIKLLPFVLSAAVIIHTGMGGKLLRDDVRAHNQAKPESSAVTLILLLLLFFCFY